MVEFPKPQRLGQMLGLGDNPLYRSFDANRNAFIQGFAGLGGMNPGQGFSQGFASGAMLDQQYADRAAQEAEQQQAKNSTLEWLKQQGYTDLVAGVEGGGLDMGTAWSEALRRNQPQSPDYTAEQRNFLFAQENPEFASFLGQGASDPTTAMQEYEFAKSQGYTGDFTTWKTDVARAGATTVDMNNSQALAGGYADRMANSDSILSDPRVEASLLDVGQSGMNAIPVAGNFITSNERKMAEQAKRDFINAILRRESGAAIAQSEFDNAERQYFPQPGDTPEVIEQKKRNRAIAIQGVARAAGPTYQAPALSSGNGWQVIGVE